MENRTLILGATTNPSRYAYKAAHTLKDYSFSFVPVGIKKGEVAGQKIINTKDIQPNIDTITLYIGPQHQPEWEEYILKTNPKRVIFNPGTENPDLRSKLIDQGIEPVEACTLVMLHTNQYEHESI